MEQALTERLQAGFAAHPLASSSPGWPDSSERRRPIARKRIGWRDRDEGPSRDLKCWRIFGEYRGASSEVKWHETDNYLIIQRKEVVPGEGVEPSWAEARGILSPSTRDGAKSLQTPVSED